MSTSNEILKAAGPVLSGKTVKDIVVGVSLTAVQLDDGSVGISYVLRDSLPNGCSVFPYIMGVAGRPAAEIASWLENGRDDLQRAVGNAVLCAASCALDIPDEIRTAVPFGLDIHPDDRAAMIGCIPPVAKAVAAAAKKLCIFDEGLLLTDNSADRPCAAGTEYGSGSEILPAEKQKDILPSCDLVIISGTALINGTMDELLSMSSNSREIVIVGPSTPMIPRGWRSSGVTRLAGSWWDASHKDDIFRAISLAGGIAHVRKYMIKKAASV